MAKKNTPGNKCCIDPCVAREDGFDRADAAALGTNWTAGGWSIESNRAVTSTSSAAAISTVDAASANGVLRLDFTGAAHGDELKLLICYADASNYLYALFKLAASAGACGTIKLYKRVSGVETQLGSERQVPSFEPGAVHTLQVCRNGEVLTGEVIRGATPIGTTVNDNSGSFTGLKSGFMTGTVGGKVRVDSFSHKHHKSDEKPSCPTCLPTGASCTLWQDTFERADSTNIGCELIEAAGDWEIDSGALAVGTTGAIVWLPQSHPDGAASYGVQVFLKPDASDFTARLIIDGVDASNHWFGEVDYDQATKTITATLGKVVGGVETILDQAEYSAFTKGTNYRVLLSVHAGMVTFDVFGDPFFGSFVDGVVLIAEAPASINLRCGLGSGSATAGDVRFESAAIGRHDGSCTAPRGNCARRGVSDPVPCLKGDSPYYLQIDLDFSPSLHPDYEFCNAPSDFEQFSGAYLLERGRVSSAPGDAEGWYDLGACRYGGQKWDLCAQPALGTYKFWRAVLSANLLYLPRVSNGGALAYAGAVVEVVLAVYGTGAFPTIPTKYIWRYLVPLNGDGVFEPFDCRTISGVATGGTTVPGWTYPAPSVAFAAVDLP